MKRTILLVDPDPERRRLIASHLETRSTGITTAEDGEQAMRALESWTPSAVVVCPTRVDNDTRERIGRVWPHLPLVVLNSELGHDPASQAAKVAAAVSGPDSFQLVRLQEILPFQQYERRILLHALETTGWNVKETAQRLQIGRATLYRKIDRYDLRARRNAG